MYVLAGWWVRFSICPGMECWFLNFLVFSWDSALIATSFWLLTVTIKTLVTVKFSGVVSLRKYYAAFKWRHFVWGNNNCLTFMVFIFHGLLQVLYCFRLCWHATCVYVDINLQARQLGSLKYSWICKWQSIRIEDTIQIEFKTHSNIAMECKITYPYKRKR